MYCSFFPFSCANNSLVTNPVEYRILPSNHHKMIESKKLLGKFERQLTKINKPPIKRKTRGIKLANILKHLILISFMILVILVLVFWNFENLRSQSGTFSRFTLNLNSNQNHQIFHHLVYLKRSNLGSNGKTGGYFIGDARISLKINVFPRHFSVAIETARSLSDD